jgi:hypothetical protein
MTTRTMISLGGLAMCAVFPLRAHAARVTSDLQPPQKRQTTVATAERLAQQTAAGPLPAPLMSPFNPPDFEKPEGGDGPSSATQRPPTGGPAATPAPAPVKPPPPLGDREVLEVLAAQLNPTGTIQFGDSPRLVMGSKRFEVGTRFTVTYNNQDYELELVAIDRTTFTLRYRGEEITRPIKSVR